MARSRGSLADPLPEAKPKSDAYTGLLSISLIGMIAGSVFLYLDYANYSQTPPAPPTKAPAATAPAGGQPGVPPVQPGTPPATPPGTPPANPPGAPNK